MKILKWIWLLFLPLMGSAQFDKTKNYRMFDDKNIHFGFMLGVNRSTYDSYQTYNSHNLYGLTSLVSTPGPGGQVGIVTSLKIVSPVLRLRFIPSLAFQEKILTLSFDNPDPLKSPIQKVQHMNSTNLEFPIMVQFRTLRMNNFTAYCLAGMQPVIDLQSQEFATQNFANPFLKTHRKDFQGQVGGGVEFFAPFFKFGIEIKYSQSFVNNFIQDNTTLSKPINTLYGRAWYLSLIFEG